MEKKNFKKEWYKLIISIGEKVRQISPAEARDVIKDFHERIIKDIAQVDNVSDYDVLTIRQAYQNAEDTYKFVNSDSSIKGTDNFPENVRNQIESLHNSELKKPFETYLTITEEIIKNI